MSFFREHFTVSLICVSSYISLQRQSAERAANALNVINDARLIVDGVSVILAASEAQAAGSAHPTLKRAVRQASQPAGFVSGFQAVTQES